MATQLEF
jgi:hypothetical protein